jgi:ketosteroid isomerase-like protein
MQQEQSESVHIELPTPIASYIAAVNRGDADTGARCFSERAVVRDEGQTMEGRAAIAQWMNETKKKYQHTIEPLTSAQHDDTTIVTNRLTGDFPGSPINLQFIFGLEGDTIASLEFR